MGPLRRFALTVAAVVALAADAAAATRYWGGVNNSAASTADNWIEGVAPTSSDTAAITGFVPLSNSGWTITTNPTGTGGAGAMKDNSEGTEWSSNTAQVSGHYVIINLGAVRTFAAIDLYTDDATNYLRNYSVFVSSDGTNWGSAIYSDPTNTGKYETMRFADQTYQYIKVQLAGANAAVWKIAEIIVYDTTGSSTSRLSRDGWIATASAGTPANAIDGTYSTRWDSAGNQVSGGTQWFKVDLGASVSISSLIIDAYTSTTDYIRNMKVEVSTDNSAWTQITANQANTAGWFHYTLPTPQTARYVRLTCVGAVAFYWSVHEFWVYGTPNTANISASAVVGAINIGKGVMTQASGQTLAVVGDFEMSGGTFTGGNSQIRVGNDLNLTGGTFTSTSSRLTVSGSFNNTGATFTPSAGVVMLDSTGLETIANNGQSFYTLNINDGLMGYWKLDEGSSSGADSSGYGHTATINGAVTYLGASGGPSQIQYTNSNAVIFGGANTQYGRVTRTTQLEPAVVTVSAWIKRNGAQTTNGKVISKTYNYGMSTPFGSYSFEMNSGGSAGSDVVNWKVGHMAGNDGLASTAGAIPDATWTHVVGTFDPTASAPQKKLYINGVLNASENDTGALYYDTGAGGDFYIGLNGNTADTQYFKGTIDEVRVYDRVLTAAEIRDLYSGSSHAASAGTHTMATALSVTDSLYLSSGTLDASAAGCSGSSCGLTVTKDWFNNGGTFVARTGRVTFSGTGSYAILSAWHPFYNVTISSTGTYTLRDRMFAGGEIAMAAASTLALGTNSVRAATLTKSNGTISGTGAVVLAAATTPQSLTVNNIATPLRIESPLDSGLVGHWKLDDGNGDTVDDVSGNGNHGTAYNNPTWSAFNASNPSSMPIDDASAMTFNGTNQYVLLGAPAVLNISGQITMAAWIKPNATDNYRNIINHGPGGSPERDNFLRIYAGKYRVGTWYSPTDTYAEYTVGSDANTWVHIVGVNDGTNWILYRNGVAVASAAGAAGAYTAAQSWSIGSDENGSERYFSGSISDVRIYSRGLSANEVAALYATGYTTGGGVTHNLAANASMTSTLKLDNGSLNAASFSNAVTGATTIGAGTYTVGSSTSGQTFTGGLAVSRYGQVALTSGGGKMLFPAAATFAMDGTLYATSTTASIEGVSAGKYNFYVGTTATATPTLNISGLQVKNTTTNGMFINQHVSASTTFTRFDNIAFSAGTGNYNLQIYATALNLTSSGCTFDYNATASVTSNVKLTGNGYTAGTPSTETRVIFGGATCANSVTCESYDADNDSTDDGIGDTPSGGSADGAVVQWVKTAGTDVAGTIEGFPTAAYNWNDFSYYATYVAYHDANGTKDTVYARTSSGGTGYSWSTSDNENIIGTPRWDTTLGGTHYVYVATTGGKVYRLIDNGSTLIADTASPWDGANNPYNCSCTITSPLAQDTNNLYWVGTASGDKLWVLSKTSTTRTPANVPYATFTTANNTAPALWVNSGGTSFIYLGLAGMVSKLNVTSVAHVANNTRPASTNPVTGRITVVHNKLYAGDDNGYMWALDPDAGFATSGASLPYWGYRDSNHSGGCGGVCQIKSHYYDPTATNVYYGDQDGHINIVATATGATIHGGYPWRPGTSSDAFATAPFHRTGIILAGTTTGTLYVIDQNAGTAMSPSPAKLRTYQFGASTKVSGISYSPTAASYMVSTANDTNKDGKLYYIDAITDTTSLGVP